MSYPIASSLLDGIVLAVVERESTYGYRITQDVQKVLEISESTLYPVLRRLQKDGCLTTYDEAYADALARAVELAKTRASVLAEASGQELGYVINIEEYGDRQEGRYVTSNMSMKSAPGAGAAEEAVMDMGVMPGEMEVTASIRIEFALLPKQ